LTNPDAIATVSAEESLAAGAEACEDVWSKNCGRDCGCCAKSAEGTRRRNANRDAVFSRTIFERTVWRNTVLSAYGITS
jgi:hypothetical protein